VLYLHGLGGSKADFFAAADPDGLPGYSLLAFDFPGCGESPAAGKPLTVDELVALSRGFLAARGVAGCTVIGHSMGGLTGLLLATRHPARVTRFITVEGNLAPEDCFISRRVVPYSADEFERTGLVDLERDLSASTKSGDAWYGAHLRGNAQPLVFYHYCRSIVEHSDEDPLLADFIRLDIPRLLVYGAENRGLTYLATLAAAGVPVCEVPGSGHFPAHSNPEAYYSALREFLEAA
jgi:pimeloyl-ACP methyl ester carboxylesterase